MNKAPCQEKFGYLQEGVLYASNVDIFVPGKLFHGTRSYLVDITLLGKLIMLLEYCHHYWNLVISNHQTGTVYIHNHIIYKPSGKVDVTINIQRPSFMWLSKC